MQEKIKVISKGYSEIDRSEAKYVKHYLENQKEIPTWIFTKAITFSTFISFLKICKKEILNALCELYAIKDENGCNKPNLLISMTHALRQLRNVCAHNERMYCFSRENKRVVQPFNQYISNSKSYTRLRSQMLIDIVLYFRYFLDNTDYHILIKSLKYELQNLKLKLGIKAFENVRAATGIRNLNVLDELLMTSKEIPFHKLETFIS